MTAQFTDPLNRVRVAAPCSADWERMRGNEQVRFCEKCSLNVYNLSAMTKRDAETLVMSTEGRLCVQYYRRTDGSILTRDCPVGLEALRRRTSRIAKATLSAALSFLAGLAGVSVFTPELRETHTLSGGAVLQHETEKEAATLPEPTTTWERGREAELPLVAGQMELAPEPVEEFRRGKVALREKGEIVKFDK